MRKLKICTIATVLTAGFTLTACTPPTPENSYIYNGINFGSDRDSSFKNGVQDACKTAEGDYTKNHDLFKTNESYRVGWEDGRLLCKGK